MEYASHKSDAANSNNASVLQWLCGSSIFTDVYFAPTAAALKSSNRIAVPAYG